MCTCISQFMISLLTAGIDQACLLTKTQRFQGLPKQIQDIVGQYSVADQVSALHL